MVITNKLLNEIKKFLEGSIEASKFADTFEGLFFGNVDSLERENFEIYDIIYDDNFIELLPDIRNGDLSLENSLRKVATQIYFKAIRLLPAEQLKQAI